MESIEVGKPVSARRRGGLARTAVGMALTALLVACSTAPSMTPSPAASILPTASPAPEPGVTDVASTPSPVVSASAPPASLPPTMPAPNPGPFNVLRAPGRAGFDMQIKCSGPIGQSDPVALVRLTTASDASHDLVLRDYANVDKPRTVCNVSPGDGYVFQLLDSRHVVVADGASEDEALFAVVDLPEVRYRWFRLPRTKGWGSELITVGPALDRVVWKSVNPDGTGTDTVYLSTATRTRVLATLPDTNSGRCGSPTDSAPGRYTTSGSYLYVLNQPILSNNSLLIFNGRESQLSIVPPHVEWAKGNEPYMAVWSPVSPTLYWSKGGDVWRWTPEGGKQRYLAGVSWYDPTISPDGRYLAYSVVGADFKSRVYLVDLSADPVPKKIGDGPRAEPRFLNSTQLWYEVGGAGGCRGSPNPYRIYSVTSGSEDASIIEYVVAAWPAASANY